MKRSIITISALLLGACLGAQNLNPEVQVTNEYKTRLDDVAKQAVEMAVPDTLLRFDYHFDYSVFDSPYKGSYEFSPYSVTITPEQRTYDGGRLYLSGGAGYTFRPELDAVWAAVDQKNLAVNVFGSGRGFLGQYHNIASNFSVFPDKDGRKTRNGWDFNAAAGVDTRFNIGKLAFRAELGYEGIYTGDEKYGNGNGHAPYTKIRFSAEPEGIFAYGGGASYRYVYDLPDDLDSVQDHEVLADFTVSVRPSEKFRVNSDINFVFNNFYWGGNLHPHALFSLGRFDFDAGLRVGWVADRFTIHPDVTASVHLFKDYLTVVAGAVGNDHFATYWDYKNLAFRRYNLSYSAPRPVNEIADLFLGVEGHADFGLQYALKAGYRFLQDAPLWASTEESMECLRFLDFGMFHSDLSLSWASERFNLDGVVHLSLVPDGQIPEMVFAPALVSATLKAGYNWKKRIFATLLTDFSTDRYIQMEDGPHRMSGYFNLGLLGEYRYSKRLSFWLKGDNLLNHDVRLTPLYSRYGVAVTAGATFTL